MEEPPEVWHVVRVRTALGKKYTYVRVPYSSLKGTYWLCLEDKQRDAHYWSDIKGIYFRDLGNMFDEGCKTVRNYVLAKGAANGRL